MAPFQITLNDEILKDLFNSNKGMTMGALFLEIDEKWSAGHRYLDMLEYRT